MKTKLLTLLAVACTTLLFHTGCDPNRLNPAKEDYPSAKFELKVNEHRQSKDFVWSAKGSTISIDPSEQELQELWLTKWNTITLTASSSDKSFQGVNFSSSSPKVVHINKIDSRSCTLEYLKDSEGPVTITAQAGSYSYSFPVYSTEVIDTKGFIVHLEAPEPIDNKTLEFNCYSTYKSPVDNGNWKYKMTQTGATPGNFLSYRGPFIITIGHLIPENASFRYVANTIYQVLQPGDCTPYGINEQNALVGLPPIAAYNEHGDWSAFEGRKGILNPKVIYGSGFVYCLVKNSKEPSENHNAGVGALFEFCY